MGLILMTRRIMGLNRTYEELKPLRANGTVHIGYYSLNRTYEELKPVGIRF